MESQAWWNFCVDCEAAAILMENLELYIGYVYLSMSYYFDSHEVASRPTAQFLKKQSHEQGEHAEKFLKYQNKQLCCKPSRSQSRAVDDYEKKCPSRLVSTSLQTHKPLTFDSRYVVSSQANIEVTPKELEFCNIQAECLQSYMEIYTKDIQGGLEFSLVEKINKEPIWEAHVRPEDATLSVSSAQTQTDEHFVNQHREQLIQRVMAVDGILDSLSGPVLNLDQIQSIRAERSSVEKMRKLYELVPKWDNDCKDRLYQALKEKHRPLVEELEGL
ncbi:NACHT, LRR and PYD domains-containing protein 1b allele 2-like isoform X2 [Trachemys scripta elegans]|uniref:NACHT, LRR and PYD domains-containing protein 1b allele 2-like isoform X2 n=1 Tax=Trachemys scripta elegans TaxID=31138 RepID=UPI0015536685|nr:NACHT, LRR and PYD domains-containing protein 1b allele 2-like isoform X2 [Trachemys scripta elegans]